MDFLHKLLNRGANIVNNDVVKPVQRDIVAPIQQVAHPVTNALSTLLGNQNPGFNVAPPQKINLTEGGNIQNQLVPSIPQQLGNDARLAAQKALGLTSGFAQNLFNAHPYTGNPVATSALNNVMGAGAEFLGLQRPNQIVLNKNQIDPSTVLHEGLHRIYASNPQEGQRFIQSYNQSATPELKNYLLSRLYPYKGATKGLDQGGVPIPNYNPNDLNSLPQNLQNEAHSFVSEYPMATKQPLPDSLKKYYGQYYDTSRSY